MIEIQSTAQSRGHVRAVFSGRCRGYAVPLDLVRVHLRAVARVALRARLAVEFGGYLVTDCEDDAALRRLEIYGRKYEAKRPAFSEGREWYAPGFEPAFVTGAAWPIECCRGVFPGGPLDAPEFYPAGACCDVGAVSGAFAQMAVQRGGYISSDARAPAFSDRRAYWLDYVSRHGCGYTCGHSGDSRARDSLRDGFDLDSIDAPEFFAAGSVRWLEYGPGVSDGFPAKRLAMRKGWI